MQIRYFLILILLSYYSSVGQNSHYWTRNYGSQSMLLSGSVIGGVSDLGAVYYNPARLALTDNPAFVLSADVYELNTYKIDDAVGNRADLKKNSFGGAPSLAAGTYKIKKWPKHFFSYAILLRYNEDLSFNYRDQLTTDVIKSSPGDELFEGEISITNKTKDEWFGLSWAYLIKENLSVGLSVFGTKTEVSKGNTFNLRALDLNNNVTILDYNRNYSIDSYNLLFKLAMAYKHNKVDYGLTMTLPRINLTGNSNYNYQVFFSGAEGSTIADIFGNSYQSDLDIDLKSPFAIGIGASYHIAPKRIIHFSAEYFSKVKNYTIMQVQPHNLQSNPDSTVNFTLYDRSKSIVNFGIGTEWYLSDKVSILASFSTDFSSIPDNKNSFINQEDIASNSVNTANYFHIGTGVLLTFKGAEFTLGATHTGGKVNFNRPIDIPDEPGNTAPIIETDEKGKLRWDRWQFIVSFSVPFIKDYAKKLEDKLLNGSDKKNN
ncbi:OmpP1/FadL family transporter [Marinigracilibium pacificum]|uniref:Long-chain fatty acid transport protein n=1 Tax=Marinigracilibium pacificum TaxID=2729599 RepID=A0A848IZH1_9BACT|nr:outer membrane protein transport protein [Marinigracilibium pacificum]NMM48771.1 long-chain fatty acid transport protein [Marinigracilibium pacificum]